MALMEIGSSHDIQLLEYSLCILIWDLTFQIGKVLMARNVARNTRLSSHGVWQVWEQVYFHPPIQSFTQIRTHPNTHTLSGSHAVFTLAFS